MNYINMSNEEAIEMIDTILEVASNRECNDVEIDAFMERALEIAKQALANPTISYSTSMNIEALEQEPSIQQEYRSFAEWVTYELFSDNWEYNRGGFEEIACRKLAKLGLVKAEGDKWVKTESEE